jgi:hypothetical protein
MISEGCGDRYRDNVKKNSSRIRTGINYLQNETIRVPWMIQTGQNP